MKIEWSDPRKRHSYYEWRADLTHLREPIASAVVFADSTDEHNEQNANFEVYDALGWRSKTGWAKNVRTAMAKAETELHKMMGA